MSRLGKTSGEWRSLGKPIENERSTLWISINVIFVAKTYTVDGKSYPAFAVTLSEMCDICSKMGYGFKVGSSIRSPQEIKSHLDGVIQACRFYLGGKFYA